MRFKVRIILLFFLAISFSLFFPKNALADSKILFSGDSTILSMNPDGTDVTSLNVTGADAQLSPDGTKIIYTAITPGTQCGHHFAFDIYVMNSDGTNIKNLTSESSCYVADMDPSWSPDGTKIVYFFYDPEGSNSPTGLHVINADGSHDTNIGVNGDKPSWSPTGSKIAFLYSGELYTANPDGSDIVDTGVSNVATQPAWSPDGTKIAFGSGSGDLIVVNADGSNENDLTSGVSSGERSSVAWSPDGSTIVYPSGGVNTIPASGGTATHLYDADSSNEYVSWGNLVASNHPPTINPLPNGTIPEGGTYSQSGSFGDSDSTSWTASVDYGDGSGEQLLSLNSDNSFSLSHQYTTPGTYTVTVNVTDNQGATGTGTATVTVNAVPPSVGAISFNTNPVQINNATTATASFTDPNGGSSDTASWNWGDGSTTSGTVTESNGSGSVTNNHTYTAAGVYTVTLTVANPTDGLSTTQTYQFLSAYEVTPNGRFAGAKEFSSPAGAYAANTSLTGTVNFGFEYKYQGGNQLFMMKLVDANKNTILNFSANSVSSLVISGTTATLVGTGSITGQSGTYNYAIVGVNNGDIRVQITDPSNNNAVIYDTQPGAALTAAPTTPITKGSGITVHN